MKRSWKYIFLLLATLIFTSPLSYSVETTSSEKKELIPVYKEMSVEEKRAARKEILQKLLEKYKENQTFAKMHHYMNEKYGELKKKGAPPYPDTLIAETLEKSRGVFEKTKSVVGGSFKRQYDPETIENTINRYAWLKGICFLILDIGEEHKIALSYFYLPENSQIKREFMIDTVKYSYPEVPDLPENTLWFTKMGEVMDRVGYKLFSVKKYVPAENDEKEKN